ncbi:LAFA_0F21198g1_1 [Lachancea sp. 'fantastica']|nr:LAFA_0F21198g1_1 [Lachancea sp. 'fantastica']
MTNTTRLFHGLNFVIVTNNKEDFSVDAIAARLKTNGANKCVVYNTKAESSDWHDLNQAKQEMCRRFDHDVHAIISITSKFWFYRVAAFDFLIPVVTPDWVQACVSTKRITRASGFSPDPAYVLKNCQIYISRHSFNSSEYELYSALLRSVGALCIDYLSSKASHILTKDAQDPAIAAVANIEGLNIKYVLPTWAVQIFMTGKYINEEGHILDPKSRPADVQTQLSNSWKRMETVGFQPTVRFLQNHKIFLSLDLTLPSQSYNFLIDLIQAAGGDVVRHIQAKDIRYSSGDCFVGQSWNSEECHEASRENLYIGNILWILQMWSLGSFVNPSEKLLLSPLRPRVFKKDELILGYTTYLGQQRNYIQKLVDALGGVSTTEFTKKNTHLLTCFPFGQKYEAAIRWKDSCKIVNHLWLEDCYRYQKQMSVDDTKYTELPVHGGLSARLGQMPLSTPTHDTFDDDPADTIIPQELITDGSFKEPFSPEEYHNTALEMDAPVDTEDHAISVINAKDTTDLSNGTHRERTPETDHSEIFQIQHDSDVISELPASKPVDAIVTIAQSDVEARRGHSEQERTSTPEVDLEIEGPNSPVGEQSPLLAGSVDATQSRQGVSSSLASEMQSQLPSSTNSRRAKEKAVMKLHTDMEALNEFQQNLKRKKSGSLLPEELQRLKQLKVMEDRVRHLLENADTPEKPKGRGKRPYDIVAVCTGCHEAIDDLDLELLKMLGITIANTITPQCNTIIAPKKLRTPKFLTSLSFHPLKYALLPEFLTSVITLARDGTSGHKLPETDHYVIPDLGKEILERTHLQTKVFQRAGIVSINVTDDVPGGQDVLSSILMAHGVQDVHVLPKKFAAEDIHANINKKKSPTHILVAQKATQAKRFSKLCAELQGEKQVMVVEWNWCVDSIFKLDADFGSSKYVVCRS